MISTTGRSPSIAAPTPAPTKPSSEIGVSRTRSGPNSSSRPCGHLVGAVEDADLLAHHEDALVAGHLLAQREAQRLAVAHRLDARRPRRGRPRRSAAPAVALTRRALRRRPARARRTARPGSMRANCAALPGAYMPRASVATSGAGLASAASTAAATRSSATRRASRRARRRATPSCGEQLAHAEDRVAPDVLVDLAARAVGEPGVGDRVAAVAVGHELEHAGAALLARRRRAASRRPGRRPAGRRRRRARPAGRRRRRGGRARSRPRRARRSCPCRTRCS